MKSFHELITFLLIILTFPLCFGSGLQWYTTCGNYFSCGNLTNVGFPFWGGSSRPKNCGHPDLELTCKNNVTTVIQIMGINYHVLEINQNSKIMRIAREDFVEGTCLQKFVNTTLDFRHFDYALGSQNVTVLYGCPPPYGSIPGQFTCRINGVNETDGYPELGALGPSGCYSSVVVPVLASSAAQIGSLSLSQIVGAGFEAKYKVENEGLCAECEASKGRCGFDLVANETSCLCLDGSVGFTPCKNTTAAHARGANKKTKILEFALSASLSAIGMVMLIAMIFYFKRRCSSNNQDVEAFLGNFSSPAPTRYRYRELKKITNSFKDRLGEGGYGTVYRGKLQNGHLVAVKLLKTSKANVEEFINEVASIGRTNHVNIVRLMGFCFEGQKRALVYEFMPNGSLNKFTYGGSNHQSLSWEKLFQIAVGIARGLEYLHRGCNTRILHFDIKPHNILLDENFSPKISDFGLAKSCPQKDSIISMSGARGTVGYIAPEVFFKSFGGVSHKSDVYSYGMLILEMIGCRRNANLQVEHSSEQYFPQWIYKQLEQEEEVDHQEILNGEEKEIQRKMILVSLWCIQTNPASRPAMTRVVEMLEGTLESLQIPPVPSLFSPAISQPDSSTTATMSLG